MKKDISTIERLHNTILKRVYVLKAKLKVIQLYEVTVLMNKILYILYLSIYFTSMSVCLCVYLHIRARVTSL